MKMKKRALALLLSMVMVLTFMPAMAFADDDLPEMVPGTLWLGCEYSGYAEFDNNMEGATLLSITSSKPNIIKAGIDYEGCGLFENRLEPVGLGSSVITATYSLKGVTRQTSALYTVKEFPIFATSLKIDDNEANRGDSENYYYQYEYTGTKPTVKYTLASGWRIVDAYYYLDDGSDDFNGYTGIEEKDLPLLEQGMTFDFPKEGYVGLRLFVDFENSSNERIMHSVHLMRGEDPYGPGDDPYDPGDDPYYPDEELNRGTPVSATFTLNSEDPEDLWGVTGTRTVENIFEPGNKFTVSYEGGDYPVIDYICVEEQEDEDSYSLGFYPFGDTSYDMFQLYPQEEELTFANGSVLQQGSNNAKIRVSFAHDDEEAAAEPDVYADIAVTGVGDGTCIHTPGGNIIENQVESACTKEYDKLVYCNTCHELLWNVHKTITKNAHVWDDGVVTTEPSCETAGVRTYTCDNCGYTRTEEIDALGHDYGAWEELNDNQHHRVCSRNNSHIEIANHSWDNGKITQRASETEEGVITYTCGDCGFTRTETIAKLEPVNTEAETAIANVEAAIENNADSDAIDAAVTEAESKAGDAVTSANNALTAAEAELAGASTGEEIAAAQAKVNAAQQNVADAKATQSKVKAVAAKVTVKKTTAAASAARAAVASAAPGSDAAVSAAQVSAQAAKDAADAAAEAVTAANDALQAVAEAGFAEDSDEYKAAEKAVTDAEETKEEADRAVTAANNEYNAAVSARNAAIAAAAAAAQPAEIIDLPAVKIAKPKAAKKKVTVKWKKVNKKNLKKIQGIEIRVTGPGVDKVVTAGKKKTSKKVGGLQSKQKYTVQVRAYAMIGGVKHVSAWKSKTVKVK